MKSQRITLWVAIGIIGATVTVFLPAMSLLGSDSRVGMTTAALPCVEAAQSRAVLSDQL